jgi:hypothetical protein
MALPSVLYCGAKPPPLMPAHVAPTLPIIGSVAPKWNVFSILISREIFIASPSKMS